jgi:hypothetical protein
MASANHSRVTPQLYFMGFPTWAPLGPHLWQYVMAGWKTRNKCWPPGPFFLPCRGNILRLGAHTTAMIFSLTTSNPMFESKAQEKCSRDAYKLGSPKAIAMASLPLQTSYKGERSAKALQITHKAPLQRYPCRGKRFLRCAPTRYLTSQIYHADQSSTKHSHKSWHTPSPKVDELGR